jgi:hypothetical protein
MIRSGLSDWSEGGAVVGDGVSAVPDTGRIPTTSPIQSSATVKPILPGKPILIDDLGGLGERRTNSDRPRMLGAYLVPVLEVSEMSKDDPLEKKQVGMICRVEVSPSKIRPKPQSIHRSAIGQISLEQARGVPPRG